MLVFFHQWEEIVQHQGVTQPTNGMAITSLIIGIISWLLFLILLCINYVLLPIFAVITMGAGAIFYIFTLAAGCISPIGWLIGSIFGYKARSQIRHTRQNGTGMANAGLIINGIGLGLTIASICGIVIYTIAVGGLGFLEQLPYQY
jgi:hypothetical protein